MDSNGKIVLNGIWKKVIQFQSNHLLKLKDIWGEFLEIGREVDKDYVHAKLDIRWLELLWSHNGGKINLFLPLKIQKFWVFCLWKKMQ